MKEETVKEQPEFQNLQRGEEERERERVKSSSRSSKFGKERDHKDG